MTTAVLPLHSLKGLGPARLQELRSAGIDTVRDLLGMMPQRYKDTRQPVPVRDLRPGQTACVEGTIDAPPRVARYQGKTVVYARLRDASGVLRLVFFNQPWIAGQLLEGQTVLLYGAITEYRGSLQLNSPSVEHERALIPVYRALPRLSSGMLRTLIDQALVRPEDFVAETLPEATRERRNLCGIHEALREIHHPTGPDGLSAAERRLTFEQLLYYVTAMRLHRTQAQNGPRLQIPPGMSDAYWQRFPYPPTGAQRRVLREIEEDLRKPTAMSRLVQGDVGSGKTAIALGAALMVIQAGYQAVLMAPTEILARQHLKSAEQTLSAYGVSMGLLVGGLKPAERKAALGAIADGSWSLVIGTHALFSPDVRYARLGLIVTDEQHRFGVRQRRALEDKAALPPHVLVMSATPIPRSLALVMYGDLDISTIDEMPPGRTPVKTRIVPDSKREGLYRFICEEAARGRQTYIVCPLVEDSDTMDVPSAQQVYAELASGPLSSLKMGLTYGSQPAQEKADTLERFAAGEIQVLVSTTVIEVGVNVPSATVMVIESADRFGLSQLHQLRGRVGRGAEASWCFLMAEPNERLNALTRTNDGFEISQEDLRERGPGDLMGVRQHGQYLPPGVKDGFDLRMINEAADEYGLLSVPGAEQDFTPVRTEAERLYQRVLPQITFN